MAPSPEASERLNLQLPDLVAANCLGFSLASDLSSSGLVSADLGRQIEERMLETAHVRPKDDDGLMAEYGSVYVRENSTLVAAGTLLKVVDDDVRFGVRIDHHQTPSDQPPPPDNYKPLSELLDITCTLLGDSVVKCQAQFEYILSDAIQSRVKLPAPLLLGDQNEDYGMTHIESLVLSRRANQGVEHTIEVIPSGDDRIMHMVAFQANTTVSEDNLNALFNTFVQLSQQLLDSRSEMP